jgi:uncharacterized membrane protein
VIRAVIMLVALAATAQADTGGSMGGGNWGSTPPPSYTPPSSPPSFGGMNIPTYTPPPIPEYHYTPPHSYDEPVGSGVPYVPTADDLKMPEEPTDWTFRIFFLVVAGFIGFTWISILRGPRPDKLDRAMAHMNDADVSVLRVALDGRTRPFIQRELTRIAGSANTATDEGRVAMLREVTMLVRRLRDAWVYGGAENEPMRGMLDSRAAFERHVDEAREKFFEETIRNEQGATTGTAASSYTPHSDEGAGLVLVSIILAARQELFTVKHVGNADELRRALEAAGHLDTDVLVAVEIVWQPSEDADRLSSVELEAKYPKPSLVPLPGALVGKTFCTYCGGPYPAELVSCPHCGAPAKKEAA